MEIAGLIMIGLGLIEGLFLCIEIHKRNEMIKTNNLLIDTMNKAKELDEKSRRHIDGTFQDPLGERYRKNPTTGLYTPIRPNRGDEADDL